MSMIECIKPYLYKRRKKALIRPLLDMPYAFGLGLGLGLNLLVLFPSLHYAVCISTEQLSQSFKDILHTKWQSHIFAITPF